jgi:uncharacterized protein YyaL (SSP411 family)
MLILFLILGGIYDHLGGGMCRYSVDRTWSIPHYEKMLYDQAQLIVLYFEAYTLTNDQFYKQIAVQIADYVCTQMQSETGGFYSAQDADSIPPTHKQKHKQTQTVTKQSHIQATYITRYRMHIAMTHQIILFVLFVFVLFFVSRTKWKV